MRRLGFGLGLGLAALLVSPAAALAGGFFLDPERVNGVFDFDDRDQSPGNNALEFEIEGRTVGVEGVVVGNTGPDVVTIAYDAGFPTQLSAKENNASLKQGRQVLVSLTVDSEASPYSGQAAPTKCKVQAKLHDPAPTSAPDDPNRAQAKLVCDLGPDFSELRDSLSAPPSSAVLDLVEAAFESRKDVKVKRRNGKLQIQHKGEPVEPE